MYLRDPRSYIQHWINHKDIIITDTGEVNDGKGRDLGDLLDTLVLDNCEDTNGYNMLAEKGKRIKPLSQKMLEASFREYVKNYILERKTVALNNIKYDQTVDDFNVVEFLTTLLGKEPSQVDIAVLKQWMWQVKRKAMGLKTEFEIMPILYSRVQGNGKTEALKRLCGPLESYCMETTVADMSDARNYFQLSTTFIGFVNEMQGCARADIDSVKRLITAEYLDVRRLGTNTKIKIQQNCSFFGTSNRHVSEILVDSQMRRFYQYNVADVFSHDKINSIDYISAWKSINEHQVTGYTREFKEDLTVYQSDYAHEDYHLTFMKEYNLLPVDENDQYSFVSVSDVYSTYCDWCVANGNKALSKNWMSIKLKSNGQISIVKQNEYDKTATYYKVPTNTNIKVSIPKGMNKVNNKKLEVL